MLKNYFKIAIAVLKRRKFFTFISLFGISVTLSILILIVAYFDHLFSPGYPDVHRNRSLYINTVVLQNEKDWNITSPPSFYFLDHYVSKLKTPSRIAISSTTKRHNVYLNGQKLKISYKYTNDQFWDVLEYEFLEGKPYNKQQVDNGDRVAVITEDAKEKYFGTDQNVTGKYIQVETTNYRVVGVVKDVPPTMQHVYAQIYIPYTSAGSSILQSKSLTGNFYGILLAGSEGELEQMNTEFQAMASKIPLPGKEYNKMYNFSDTYFVSFMRSMFGQGEDSGLETFYTAISIFVFLFLLLPTLNLININISRIMERYSEIGVRKAFGASSHTLVLQFIVENIILTLLGGAIGIILSLVVIYFFNASEVIPNGHLRINIPVLLYTLLATLLFGFLSGVYPAWRMSRLQVVAALKAS
ncbi:MAG: FtsX-like permease family protein [Sphingobacteriales bacterium]|nr:MAG: FtsX-like permease family protein [Sphingobacteriales bacterium]